MERNSTPHHVKMLYFEISIFELPVVSLCAWGVWQEEQVKLSSALWDLSESLRLALHSLSSGEAVPGIHRQLF